MQTIRRTEILKKGFVFPTQPTLIETPMSSLVRGIPYLQIIKSKLNCKIISTGSSKQYFLSSIQPNFRPIKLKQCGKEGFEVGLATILEKHSGKIKGLIGCD